MREASFCRSVCTVLSSAPSFSAPFSSSTAALISPPATIFFSRAMRMPGQHAPKMAIRMISATIATSELTTIVRTGVVR